MLHENFLKILETSLQWLKIVFSSPWTFLSLVIVCGSTYAPTFVSFFTLSSIVGRKMFLNFINNLNFILLLFFLQRDFKRPNKIRSNGRMIAKNGIT